MRSACSTRLLYYRCSRTAWVALRGGRIAPQVAACAAPRPAHDRRPILSPPPRPPCQIRGAASSPPTGTSPAGWRSPGRRCPGPSRGPARTAPGPPSPSEALGSIPSDPVSIAASSRQDVAEHVLGQDHLEVPRGGDQPHRGVVDQQVLELDVRELACVHLADDLAPQAAGLEHVGLVDARHPRPRRR